MDICLSISQRNPVRWLTLAQSQPLVELRGDLMGISQGELKGLLSHCNRAIVTCHSEDREYALGIYLAAIEAGAWAVDIDYLSPLNFRQHIAKNAHQKGVTVIFSRHYTNTPPLEELVATAEGMFAEGCYIAKVITTATTTAEALVPLGLYERFESGRLVAFAMGSEGAFTRRLSLLRGAPYTYAAPSAKERTAEGQLTIEELQESFRAGYGFEHIALPHSATPPCSKSEAQRAIVLATLTEGTTTIENYTPCGDSLAAEGVAVALGAHIAHPTPTTLRIEGIGVEGVRKRLCEDNLRLSVGESALLARITLPIVALLGGGTTIEGKGTLLGRSLASDIVALERFGADCSSESGKLPITIHSGAKIENKITIDGSHSSQSVTGWMLALGATGGEHTLEVTNPTSRPYILLTARMMEQFGASVTIEGEDKFTITIDSTGYHSATIRLRADWSGASYFAAAFAVAQSGKRIAECYTLRATTHTEQADEAVLDILRSAEAEIEYGEGEVRFLPSGRLRGFDYDATHTPDLVPTLAVLALFCEGSSRIGGLSRLRNKESNRTEALVENLMALGARVAIEGDELVVWGTSDLRSAPLRSHNDHRIAMALAVAALFMPQKPTIDNVECVAKSFPDFFEQLTAKQR